MKTKMALYPELKTLPTNDFELTNPDMYTAVYLDMYACISPMLYSARLKPPVWFYIHRNVNILALRRMLNWYYTTYNEIDQWSSMPIFGDSYETDEEENDRRKCR